MCGGFPNSVLTIKKVKFKTVLTKYMEFFFCLNSHLTFASNRIFVKAKFSFSIITSSEEIINLIFVFPIFIFDYQFDKCCFVFLKILYK